MSDPIKEQIKKVNISNIEKPEDGVLPADGKLDDSKLDDVAGGGATYGYQGQFDGS